MKIRKESVGPCTVFSWGDSISLEGSASTLLKDELKSSIAGGASRVVLDLARVEFIDSSGLGALISALKALRQKDGSLWLARVSEPVAHILEVTRLDRVFDTALLLEDALRESGADEPAGSEVSG